jgi:hypothetical protein
VDEWAEGLEQVIEVRDLAGGMVDAIGNGREVQGMADGTG